VGLTAAKCQKNERRQKQSVRIGHRRFVRWFVRGWILAARRYAAFWNTGEASFAEAALAGNFADRTLPSGRRQGIKGVLEASKNFRAAIPDLKAEIEELLVVNDRAVVRYIFTGHFTGTFKDLKGDGREISFRAG
jgi:predicted ester cyclase